jgi:hypothetical protein
LFDLFADIDEDVNKQEVKLADDEVDDDDDDADDDIDVLFLEFLGFEVSKPVDNEAAEGGGDT